MILRQIAHICQLNSGRLEGWGCDGCRGFMAAGDEERMSLSDRNAVGRYGMGGVSLEVGKKREINTSSILHI